MAKSHLKIQIKTAAYPKEHGSWGFTLEPLILALIIGYSTAGFYLALGTFLAFLVHQPIRLLLAKGHSEKKTAAIFFLLYGINALLFFYLFLTNVTITATIPFLSALLLMFFYLLMEYLHLHRQLFIEILAPMAISLIAVSILLASGWSLLMSFGVFILLAARFLPTAFYVHYKLQRAKHQHGDKASVVFTSGLGFFLVTWLTTLGIIPILGLVGVTILSGRAFIGILDRSNPRTVKQVGIREFIYGIILILLASMGYLLSW